MKAIIGLGCKCLRELFLHLVPCRFHPVPQSLVALKPLFAKYGIGNFIKPRNPGYHRPEAHAQCSVAEEESDGPRGGFIQWLSKCRHHIRRFQEESWLPLVNAGVVGICKKYLRCSYTYSRDLAKPCRGQPVVIRKSDLPTYVKG